MISQADLSLLGWPTCLIKGKTLKFFYQYVPCVIMGSVKQGGINTTFRVLGLTRLDIEPRSRGALANTLTIMPRGWIYMGVGRKLSFAKQSEFCNITTHVLLRKNYSFIFQKIFCFIFQKQKKKFNFLKHTFHVDKQSLDWVFNHLFMELFTSSSLKKFVPCRNSLRKPNKRKSEGPDLDCKEDGVWRCPWCNCYSRRKWTRRHEFKSWTRLIAFHIALIPLGKVWIQLFSLQLWVNSRTN